MASTTPKYGITTPDYSTQFKDLGLELQQMGASIEQVLSTFDYNGADPEQVLSTVAAHTLQLTNIIQRLVEQENRFFTAKVSITPVANTVTGKYVSFPAGQFDDEPIVVATGWSAASALQNVSVSDVTKDGATINVLRTTATTTSVFVFAMDRTDL